MTARETYTLTEAQYRALQEAWRPVPIMVVGGVIPDRYASMDAAWIALGKELGFVPESVEWISHEARTFAAEPAVKP